MTSVTHNTVDLNDLPLASRGIYFIGIGGIGMSALARYFLSKGIKVSGYDRTATNLTRLLEQEGADIHYEENVELIPKDPGLVVYTPAVPQEHAELLYYRRNGYNVVKRSDVLKLITESSFNICVAGTHGKTTVSTMIAHILRHSGFGCNAFLGGVSANYNTNFWSSSNNACVIEADEYDRSFLKLSPDVAVITATDADHLDIYGTPEEVENAFILFSDQIKKGGLLIRKFGLARSAEFKTQVQRSYAYNNKAADVLADNVHVVDGSYHFNVIDKDWLIEKIVLNMGGLHNIENMVVAIAVARHLNIPDNKIREAVKEFRGVKRRFELILRDESHVLIDDYAHHPEELRALINGVRSLYHKRFVLVFQPHLYSRTKDLANEFAESLALADEVILLPVYGAREAPQEGVESSIISTKIAGSKSRTMEKTEMLEWVRDNQPELLVMAGAGDIDALVQPVKELLQSR